MKIQINLSQKAGDLLIKVDSFLSEKLSKPFIIFPYLKNASSSKSRNIKNSQIDVHDKNIVFTMLYPIEYEQKIKSSLLTLAGTHRYKQTFLSLNKEDIEKVFRSDVEMMNVSMYNLGFIEGEDLEYFTYLQVSCYKVANSFYILQVNGKLNDKTEKELFRLSKADITTRNKISMEVTFPAKRFIDRWKYSHTYFEPYTNFLNEIIINSKESIFKLFPLNIANNILIISNTLSKTNDEKTIAFDLSNLGIYPYYFSKKKERLVNRNPNIIRILIENNIINEDKWYEIASIIQESLFKVVLWGLFINFFQEIRLKIKNASKYVESKKVQLQLLLENNFQIVDAKFLKNKFDLIFKNEYWFYLQRNSLDFLKEISSVSYNPNETINLNEDLEDNLDKVNKELSTFITAYEEKFSSYIQAKNTISTINISKNSLNISCFSLFFAIITLILTMFLSIITAIYPIKVANKLCSLNLTFINLCNTNPPSRTD